MLKVAVIVLIRFGVHDDGVVDPRAIHAFQQMLRRGRRRGTVWRSRMVRKACIIRASEAVQVCINHNWRIACLTQDNSRRGHCSRLQELAS
jgi:hypothetical protein